MIKVGIKVITKEIKIDITLTKKEQKMYEWLESELPFEEVGGGISSIENYRFYLMLVVKGQMGDNKWKPK